MQRMSISYALIYQFKHAKEYKVSKCLKVFNTKTNRQIKKCYNSGSIGFWIKGKFIILKDKKLLELIPKEKLPF